MALRFLASTFRSIWTQRALIWQLARHQLKQQYAATFIGSLWAIIQPVATIMVFWFVFSYGFKMQHGTGGAPYFLVLFCGFIPWMMFGDALSGATNSIMTHGYLVKKIAFPLEILPVVHIVSACIVHVGMVLFIVLLLAIYGIWPTVYVFQLFYFMLATIVFLAGITWIMAALNVFQRDVGQSLGLILTLWFWLTPIVWPGDKLKGWSRTLVELNPLYYIVEGYRNSLLYHKPMSTDWHLGVYFWGVSLLFVVLGSLVFRRLKPHFADVM